MTRPLATDVVQAIAREPSETKPESEEETISALRMLMTEIEEIDRLEKHPEPVAEASPAPAFRL
ncbi:MAG: hypothetical protein ING19_19190 [Azospirillum sp.]|nr:hypothetical protein [Azospirillum sp.]